MPCWQLFFRTQPLYTPGMPTSSQFVPFTNHFMSNSNSPSITVLGNYFPVVAPSREALWTHDLADAESFGWWLVTGQVAGNHHSPVLGCECQALVYSCGVKSHIICPCKAERKIFSHAGNKKAGVSLIQKRNETQWSTHKPESKFKNPQPNTINCILGILKYLSGTTV